MLNRNNLLLLFVRYCFEMIHMSLTIIHTIYNIILLVFEFHDSLLQRAELVTVYLKQCIAMICYFCRESSYGKFRGQGTAVL